MLLRECAFKGIATGTRRRSCFIMHILLCRLTTRETLGGLNGYTKFGDPVELNWEEVNELCEVLKRLAWMLE